ncbi:MAG: tRNA (adenosine(37)-N6)-threonylcarbamoyltransferase complex dimerization subunit type 1 TsaB [Gammaproteobacteria bacterium]|nr:tRNA (adenosine(37)-N6)-threonylcarbamoyltransferase complex dimerization subunit type 1 TsaB [Gammaproteobacteria bacterium]
MSARLLALETSGDVGSVALLADGAVSERTISSPREQTDAVLPHVQGLLADAGLELGDLDGIAFGRGPGSFTGLRVATAVAHGFGLTVGLPLLPVSSLAALAQGAWRGHGIERCLVCIDARMGEVYWAAFEIRDGLANPIGAEKLGSPAAARWDALARPWAAVGNGFAAYVAELASLTASAETVLADVWPAARDLLPVALEDLAQGRSCSVEDALPVYLRPETAWKR